MFGNDKIRFVLGDKTAVSGDPVNNHVGGSHEGST